MKKELIFHFFGWRLLFNTRTDKKYVETVWGFFSAEEFKMYFISIHLYSQIKFFKCTSKEGL